MYVNNTVYKIIVRIVNLLMLDLFIIDLII